MYLTKDEEALLRGEGGEAKRLAMEILVALGDIYGAERMVKVDSVHISGTSYTSCGDAGIHFLSRLVRSGAKLAVPSTLNPVSIPLNRWRELGFPERLAAKQLEILSLYKLMGAAGGYTCHPYLVGNVPRYGSHISWAESSAIVYANSMLGARTNREGGIGALASALVGLTPLYGYHLAENRRATVKVEVEAELIDTLDYSLLGYIIGELIIDGVPLIAGLPSQAGLDELKAMGASMATSGSIALFHALNLTPEAGLMKDEGLPKLTIDSSMLRQVREKLSSNGGLTVDCVALGCPHLSLSELKRIASFLEGRKVKEGVRLWLFTSEGIKRLGEEAGYVDIIEAAGGRILTGGCVVHTPLEEIGVEVLATNSAKAAHYCLSLHEVKVCIGSLKECLEAALTGRWVY